MGTSEYKRLLREHIEHVDEIFSPMGLRGYIIIANDKYEIVYINWESETEAFFQQLGVKTRLTDYGVREDQLPGVIDKLKQHGMVELGEHGKVSPDISLNILQASL